MDCKYSAGLYNQEISPMLTDEILKKKASTVQNIQNKYNEYDD